MPYRALMWTIITVAAALVAVGLWVKSIEPIVVGMKSERPVTTQRVIDSGGTTVARTPYQEMTMLVKGTALLSFLLICMLMAVGFFATVREWVRFRNRVREKPEPTPYVDAWKLAAERMKEKTLEEDEDDEE